MTLMAQTWSIWGSLASSKAKISEPRLPTPISTNTRRISENVIPHASQKLHKHKLNYTIPLVDGVDLLTYLWGHDFALYMDLYRSLVTFILRPSINEKK
jgi:hypothetical protein